MRSESELMQLFVGSKDDKVEGEYTRQRVMLEVLLDIRAELKSLVELARQEADAE